jgi:hypothetical protein
MVEIQTCQYPEKTTQYDNNLARCAFIPRYYEYILDNMKN